MSSQNLVDRFCESRHRWLIVTGVTFVAALATVLPQVDQYLSLLADEDAKTKELLEAGQTAELLEGMRVRVATTTDELTALESRTLPADGVSAFRNGLVDIVRESGCQVRRIGVGSVRTRQWHEHDDPLSEGKNAEGPKSPFKLETRPVNLAVTGSMSEVRNLLTKIDESPMMTYAHGLTLKPAGRGDSVQLDIELWCFALSRGKAKS